MLVSPAPDHGHPSRTDYTGLLLIVLAIGSLLRLVALDRVPPGLHFDEAAYGLLALEVLHGERPVFFHAYTGREPLFVYLVAGATALLGPAPLTIRLVAALAGVLTIVTTWWVGRLLLGPRVALVGAAVFATSLWPVLTTRLGYRANLVPLAATLIVGLLWRAGQCRRATDWLLAGGALGLSLYTYPSARFLPLLVLTFGLSQVVTRRPDLRADGRGLVLYSLTALVVALPLVLHFARYPADFSERLRQVSALSPDAGPGPVLTHAGRTLAMFVRQGSSDVKYNLPNQPVFDPPLAVLFGVGLGMALRSFRQPAPRLLVLWWGMMLLPGALSTDSPHPLRTLGAAPPAHLLAGLGAVGLADQVRRRLPAAVWPRADRLALVGGSAALLALAGLTADRYFRLWAASPATHCAQMGDVAMAAVALERLPATGLVFFATDYAPHPTVAYLSPARYPILHWFDPTRMVVFPPPGVAATYVIPATPPPTVAGPLLTGLPLVASGRRPDGTPGYAAFLLAADAPRPLPPATLSATVGERLVLHSALVPSQGQSGQTITVRLVWQIGPEPPAPGLSIRLVDPTGSVWAQQDSPAAPPGPWVARATIIADYRLTIPAVAPPFPGEVRLVVYDPDTLRPLPIVQPGGPRPDLRLGSLTVVHRPPPVADRMTGTAVGPGLWLHQAVLEPPVIAPGATLHLRLLWQATPGPRPRQVTLEIVGDDSRPVASWALPVIPGYPADQWPTGDLVEQRTAWPLPSRLPDGRYHLRLIGQDGHSHPVGVFQVTAPARQFAPPADYRPDGRTIAGLFRLAGYRLSTERLRPGETLVLDLAWEAMAETDASYKVFTHLLDTAGRLTAQHDKYPADGARLTSGWLTGEVVTDRYLLTIPASAPPGRYSLVVGWYDEATGRRLPADGGGDTLTLPVSLTVEP